MSSSADTGGGRRDTARSRPAVRTRSDLGLDESLTGTPGRLAETLTAGDRLHSLLNAVLAIHGELELDSTLRRTVRVALDLVEADSGALTMFDPENGSPDSVVEGHDPMWPSRTTAPQEDEPDPSTELSVPVRVRDEVVGTLYVRGKRRGGDFSAGDRAVLRVVAATAGVAVENARLFERARVRGRWLEAVAALNAELLGGASLNRSLRRVVEIAKELSDADTTLLLLTEADGALSVGAVSDPIRHLDEGALVIPGPVLTDVLRMVEPVTLEDLGRETTSLPPSVSREFGPAVISPLRSAEGMHGLLVALRKNGATGFTRQQIAAVSSFAAQATFALRFADKRESERAVALLTDRDRIAQDLHDHVIQRLFAASMSLQGALRQTHDPRTAERIGDAMRRLDLTVKEIRTSIFELHSVGTGKNSLRRRLLDAVPVLPQGFPTLSVRIGGAVDTFVPESLGRDMEVVVREAVRRLVRQAQDDGTAAEITLDVEVDDAVRIDITVAGPISVPADSRWLEQLRRRSRDHGGKTVVDDHGGTVRLLWTAPLPTSDAAPPRRGGASERARAPLSEEVTSDPAHNRCGLTCCSPILGGGHHHDHSGFREPCGAGGATAGGGGHRRAPAGYDVTRCGARSRIDR